MDFSEGVKFYYDKKFSQALAFFLALPESEDAEERFKVLYYLGLCNTQLERFEDAIDYLEQLVTSDENIARVYQCRLILAYIYAKTGRSRLAEFELSKLTGAGYESVQVYTSLGYVAYEHGDVDKAVESYSKALELNDENSTAQNGLGYVYADSGRDLRQALVLCKKAVEANPENPAYLDSLAWVYHKMEFNNEAKDLIKKVKELLPDNPIAEAHFQEIMQKGD